MIRKSLIRKGYPPIPNTDFERQKKEIEHEILAEEDSPDVIDAKHLPVYLDGKSIKIEKEDL